MSEIDTLRGMRPAPPPAELEAMRRAARERFVAGTGSPRTPQRWRLPVLAGGLTAAAAAAAAAALVLTSGPGAVPGQHGTAGHSRTVVTAAWTVREDADGTVTIYLRQYANPAALQQTLQADGINAIVRPIPSASRTSSNGTITYPTCNYAPADAAPPTVQRAVVTFAGQDLPVRFIIHPDAIRQGSALFLAFMGGVGRLPKNGNTGVLALPPVVLDNDTVPACVPRTKPAPFSVLPAPPSAPKAK
jgi:hypothetical protein